MYFVYIFSSDNSDDTEMLRQIRLLYADQIYRLTRMLNKCSQNFSVNFVGVSLRLFIVLIFGLNTKKLHFLSFQSHTIMCVVKYWVSSHEAVLAK